MKFVAYQLRAPFFGQPRRRKVVLSSLTCSSGPSYISLERSEGGSLSGGGLVPKVLERSTIIGAVENAFLAVLSVICEL
jgi:hypothetical protein